MRSTSSRIRVLLLDEIEKAHPDLFNILLQVMDNGKLTDHHGKTVDFRNVILIMTTNAGASDMAREASASATSPARARRRKRSRRCSRRNSATASMRSCRSLSADAGGRAGGRQVHPPARTAAGGPQRPYQLDDEAKAWLTEKGYDKLYGARPMGRLIQEKIKQPLAEELLFGKLVHGGEVKVKLKDGALAFEITPAAPKPKALGKRDGPTAASGCLW
jgi:ATP-dependent Clp protease ATP-binding subunit ClpA